MNDLVSIVMPCYNSEKYVSESIQSIINQNYKNWELIVIDDCSVDGTYSLLEKLSRVDTRIKISRNLSNLGGAKTRNVAIEKSSGRYIAFLDSDDLWLPSKLEKQINFMRSKSVGFSYSNYLQFGGVDKELSVNAPIYISYRDMIKINFIGCLTVIYDTSFYGKFYFPITKKRHDYALWLDMLKQFDYAYNVGGVLASYRVHSNSLSANKTDAFQSYFYVLRKLQGLSYFESLVNTLIFTFSSILKKKCPKAYYFLVCKLMSKEF